MSLIAEARNEILGWDEEGPPQYVQLRPEVAEALLDVTRAALELDIGGCRHGLSWAHSEGAMDDREEVDNQLDALEAALAPLREEDA